MRYLMLCVIAASTSGCGIGPSYNAGMSAQSAINSGLQECQQKYPKRQKGNAAAALRCSNGVYEQYAWVSAGNNGDLVRLAGLKSVEAAERYDAGKITDAQFDLELATIDSQFKTEMANRTFQSASASAAQQQAAAAQRQAAMQQMATGMAIMNANKPPPPAPLPTNTRCTTYGNTTNCNSF